MASRVLHIIPCAPPLFTPGTTLASTRLRWLTVFDDLLDALERQIPIQTLTLDEGSAPLELYLQFRPERYEQIERLVQRGVLQPSPWYVRPDLARHDSETTIRNLALGSAIGAALGQRPASACVLSADPIPEQMPQLLRGAGIERLLLPADDSRPSAFTWSGADGTRIAVGCVHPVVPRPLASRHTALLYRLRDRADLMRLPQVMHELRPLPGMDVMQSTCDAYMQAVEQSASLPDIQPVAVASATPAVSAFERLHTTGSALAAAYCAGRVMLPQPQEALHYAWKQTLLGSDAGEEMAAALAEYADLNAAVPVAVDNAEFHLTTIKLPDDGRTGVIVRGENRSGVTQAVRLQTQRPFARVQITDLLENPTGGALPVDAQGAVHFQAGPRRLLTFRFHDDSEIPR